VFPTLKALQLLFSCSASQIISDAGPQSLSGLYTGLNALRSGTTDRLLDNHMAVKYNSLRIRDMFLAEIAQLVEHATENRGVVSSILTLGTLGP
jgi:hypothetical protein